MAQGLLAGLAQALGEDAGYFASRFDKPMALLRGNYYPQRPDWAGANDYGIAPHTDYGCLTLLGSDGVPGLEVLAATGDWVPVTAEPGTFVINFGEMLELWTAGQVKATLHRVRGSSQERISVPLFFNPNFDADVAPKGAAPILAGDHLSKRFEETYLHMSKTS
ncbi:2OG-Fe(II) oxygenase family protein [Litorisediminicola beolgyonensis]|uniref:2-oxoglutarate-dependent ethylene/succinate-forming enzyme n=1 Tax=Litorisediminicola beolgyonensis TaxID=1173614 RepID=A0ABW3ZFP5_9RHOB